MRSQARSRAASSGQRATATQLNQCSTKYRAGSKLYSSRARAVAAVQSDSNLARAAGSSRATAARIAAGSRSGSGTTGWSPDTGRWLMKPMLKHPSDIGRLPTGHGRAARARRGANGTSTPPRPVSGHQPVNTGPDASSTRDGPRTDTSKTNGTADAGQRRAGQLQRVVEPLALGAIVFRVGLIAERLQHRAHRGRALGGQIILANAAQN